MAGLEVRMRNLFFFQGFEVRVSSVAHGWTHSVPLEEEEGEAEEEEEEEQEETLTAGFGRGPFSLIRPKSTSQFA